MQKWKYLYAEATLAEPREGSGMLMRFENGLEVPIKNGDGYFGKPTLPMYLDEKGEVGWELVSAYPVGPTGVRLFLRKPKND